MISFKKLLSFNKKDKLVFKMLIVSQCLMGFGYLLFIDLIPNMKRYILTFDLFILFFIVWLADRDMSSFKE